MESQPGDEEEDATTTQADEDLQLYVMFAHLRSAGNRDYHNLTATYLTANSILVGAIGLMLSMGPEAPHSGPTRAMAILLSLVGLWFAYQLFIAQGRFRAQNYYLERNLRLIEKKPEWRHPQYFVVLQNFTEQRDGQTDYRKIRDKSYEIPAEDGEPPMQPNFGVRHHRDRLAPRMKGLPFFFFGIFALFILYAVFFAR